MDWYNNVLDTSSLPYDYWLAAYPYNDQGQIVESLRPAVGIGWQYTDNGSVAGISGPVDRDVFYRDDFESGKDPYKEWVGECTGNGVNVRRGPGTEYAPITGYPRLDRGNLVDVIGEKRARDCGLWYFVRIAGQYEGYVYHTYLKQA
ncbi:MAG: SH3 domain-containing protein [Clostridiales bacterium]|nr:SH3 domain-containing protein [Clostridiales bacterium]